MSIHRVAGFILAGFPLLAAGQVPTADMQAMQQRQQQLETQVREQNARIAELERMVRDLAAGQAATAKVETKPKGEERPTELSEPATYPARLAAAPSPGPEYIGNLGFKIYESERAQIYMRLFSYARYLNQKDLDPTYTDFIGAGTAAIPNITDDGFQVQASAMILPRLLQLYLGVSEITGDFGDGSEFRAGFNYFPQRMRGIRVNGEWLALDDCPVG